MPLINESKTVYVKMMTSNDYAMNANALAFNYTTPDGVSASVSATYNECLYHRLPATLVTNGKRPTVGIACTLPTN